MTYEIDNGTADFLSSASVFCQPWWLEAIAPGHWDVAVVRRGDAVVAALPYVFKLRLGRYRLIELQPFAFYLGPWLKVPEGKAVTRLSDEKQLMMDLIDQLPEFASFHQWFHPDITNWLPFYWNGYTQTTRYTYVIPDTTDLDSVWGAMRKNIRTDVRKAERRLVVTEDSNVDRLLAVESKMYAHQGMALPYARETLIRLDQACASRECRKVLVAEDQDGRAHGAIFLVRDHRAVYALLRSGDPEFKGSGSGSLLLWEAIRFASSLQLPLDFTGAWVEPIERFVRSFGAVRVPFFEVSKSNSRLVRAYRAAYALVH
jgi:hypothetical protein